MSRDDLTVEVSREEFKALCENKLNAGKALRDARLWSDAYYLAGYAVECALKACIAKRFKAETLPDKKTVTDIYTHDLVALLRIANLERALLNDGPAAEWGSVKTWKERSRYTIQTEQEADELINAIDAKNGVLAWIQKVW